MQGPFNTFKLTQDKDCDWTGLKFSPDGKTILIATNGEVVHLVDAFDGNKLHTFTVRFFGILWEGPLILVKFGCYSIAIERHSSFRWNTGH